MYYAYYCVYKFNSDSVTRVMLPTTRVFSSMHECEFFLNQHGIDILDSADFAFEIRFIKILSRTFTQSPEAIHQEDKGGYSFYVVYNHRGEIKPRICFPVSTVFSTREECEMYFRANPYYYPGISKIRMNIISVPLL